MLPGPPVNKMQETIVDFSTPELEQGKKIKKGRRRHPSRPRLGKTRGRHNRKRNKPQNVEEVKVTQKVIDQNHLQATILAGSMQEDMDLGLW